MFQNRFGMIRVKEIRKSFTKCNEIPSKTIYYNDGKKRKKVKMACAPHNIEQMKIELLFGSNVKALKDRVRKKRRRKTLPLFNVLESKFLFISILCNLFEIEFCK